MIIEVFVLALISAVVGLTAIAKVMSYLGTLDTELDPFWRVFRLEPYSIAYGLMLAMLGTALVAILPDNLRTEFEGLFPRSEVGQLTSGRGLVSADPLRAAAIRTAGR